MGNHALLSASSSHRWLGLLLDLWECHKQFMGLAHPKRELTIDDIIPEGI